MSHKSSHILCSALDKEAAYVLWDYGQDVIGTLPGLMKILETRFGGKAMSDKHRIELRNRRRNADETLQSVHSDIRRLAALAYPGVPPEMRETVTCDHFLDALGDPDLVFKIRERHPADLDSALKIALQLEVWQKRRRDTKTRRSRIKTADGFEKFRLSKLNRPSRKSEGGGQHKEVHGVRAKSDKESERWCIRWQLSTASGDQVYLTEHLQWGTIRST